MTTLFAAYLASVAVILFTGVLLVLSLWAAHRYRAILEEDARKQAEREDEAEAWEWPVKLAGPENRTRLPL